MIRPGGAEVPAVAATIGTEVSVEQGDRTQLLVLRVICASLAASVVLYALIGWLAVRGAARPGEPAPPLLAPALAALAAAFL
ncbi:MAG: hypothetical protein D6739_03270, partial [Nitrospirae bacterium]